MLIDFNPHVINFNSVPQIIKTNKQVHFCSQTKDIFVKSINPLYEGIKIDKKSFGKIRKTGERAELYSITNINGASVSLSTFGATITGIKVPDKNGKLVDVTHGYSSVTPYELYPVGHAGGTIGPYANKISAGKFSIGENKYFLECNKDGGKNHSHGGSEGFDVQNWQAKVLNDGIEFTYVKKDRQNGYPGNVTSKVTYKLDNENNLHIQYNSTSDKDTLINLTNHSYFNLDGASNVFAGSVKNHIVTLPNSSKITKIGNLGIPTGEFMSVENTPFDFSKPTRIGDVINSNNEQIKLAKGFDHNYCVDGYDGKNLVEIAEIYSEKTGINLKVSSNLPGFQFYTGNNLGKASQPQGKDWKRYERHSGLCIEPQFYPNAINTESFSEKGILKAGEEYNREIVYSFSVK